jgi:benzoylformate decarboxylase
LEGAAPERPQPKPWARPAPPAPEPLTNAYVFSRLAALRAPGSIIVEEAPSARGPMHDFLPILRPDTFYTCASGGLGYSLPAAVGVALGRPGEKVIALIGDGSAMYAIQALWSAAQLRLPISFVILNNARYEALIGFGRRFGLNRTIGTDLSGLDFVALAEGQGVAAARVDSAAALDAALSQSLSSPEPNLLEILID